MEYTSVKDGPSTKAEIGVAAKYAELVDALLAFTDNVRDEVYLDGTEVVKIFENVIGFVNPNSDLPDVIFAKVVSDDGVHVPEIELV